MDYLIIENDINLIMEYDKIGVNIIFLDLEILGKKQRQGHLNTVISENHSIDDVKKISSILKNSKLLVRINPINKNTKIEIDKCINDGADILMLPMFKDASEVKNFISLVDGRVRTCLLLETKEAVNNLDTILKISNIEEVYIGLNDLHLSLKMNFIFEPLSCGIVDSIVDKLNKKNIRFGFGGISTISGGKISGSMVLKEHLRLGSSMVILSRDFKNLTKKNLQFFKNEFRRLKDSYKEYKNLSRDQLIKNHKNIVEKILNIT